MGPREADKSPFFAPSTPHIVVVQQTPGGTRRSVSVKEEIDEHKSTLMGCTANLINAIVGSGIVGIPYAVRQTGFVAGIALIIICAIITEKSLRLLISTAKHVHVPSYETVAEAAFGLAGFRFVAANMFVMAYGAMLSYLMVVKDVYSSILGIAPTNLPMKRAVLFIISLSIMVPLSSQRDMADLAKTSRLSVIIDTLLVGMVLWNSPITESVEARGGWSDMWTTDLIHPSTIFVGLGVLSFAFVCQHSAFIIAGSLDNPTTKRWGYCTASALVLCAILALACGISGYAGYQRETQGNILNNLDPSSVSANLARGMLGTTMLFVFPLECFVARHVCVVLLFKGRRAHEGDDTTILNRRDRRIGLTVLLYAVAVLPAAMFEDMGSVLAITGAVGGSCLSYVGPGLVYMGIHGGRFLELIQRSWLGSMLDLGTNTGVNSLAVETTPLVASSSEAVKMTEKLKDEPSNGDSKNDWYWLRLARFMAWYLGGFPIWCAIAKSGKRSLTKHVHEMALKSPHPIRIGDVEYSRVPVNRHGAIEADPESASAVLWPPRRENSLPMLAAKPLSSAPTSPNASAHGPPVRSGGGPPTSFNQRIAQDILKKQKQKQHTVETDPQEEAPSWYDFFVAIFFILFGALAFFAGIFSLFISEESGSARRAMRL